MSTYEALKYTFTGANLTSIPTSAITSGTFADARISSDSVTQHVSATTQASGTWTPAVSTASVNSAGRYVRVGNIVVCTGQGNWTSTASVNSNVFQVSGLPITSSSSGTNVGNGKFTTSYDGGYVHNVKVVPNSTLFELYNSSANLTTTSEYVNSKLNDVFGRNMDSGGYRVTHRNLEESSNSNSKYFSIFLVYMVG